MKVESGNPADSRVGQSVAEENRNCQGHSQQALGYLRRSASGMRTSPHPPARSRACFWLSLARCSLSLASKARGSGTTHGRVAPNFRH
jgi:hypothetical protein